MNFKASETALDIWSDMCPHSVILHLSHHIMIFLVDVMAALEASTKSESGPLASAPVVAAGVDGSRVTVSGVGGGLLYYFPVHQIKSFVRDLSFCFEEEYRYIFPYLVPDHHLT